jgi:hypothetical protein
MLPDMAQAKKIKRILLESEQADWSLSPEEWDFHDVEAWEVEWVVRHEYARECPEQAMQLATLIRPNVLRHAIGVGLALEAAMKSGKPSDIESWEAKWGKFYWLHEFVSKCLRQIFNCQLVIAIETAARFGVDYREPWMTNRNKILAKVHRSNECIKNLPLVRLKPLETSFVKPLIDAPPLNKVMSILLPELMDGFRDASVAYYSLRVDWSLVESAGMEKLRADIMRQLGTFRPPRSVVGRGAEVPYDKLRALAAWRLSKKAGVSFDGAMQIIRRRATDLGYDLKSKQPTGFPNYSSEPGWQKAIKRADSLIKQLQRQN